MVEVQGVATSCFTVDIEICNVFGERMINEIPLNPPFAQKGQAKGEIEVDVSGLAAGVYYVVVTAGGERFSRKFSVLR